MKNIILLICLCASFVFIKAKAQSNNNESWHGFKKVSFKIDTASAYIVVPEKPLTGNPWLWRTYSPEFHIEIDSLLVLRGFHIAYININNKLLYGQPSLMDIWNKFYVYLVNEKKFAKKPALSGAVRGSLCEFAWAKLYPDRVSCMLKILFQKLKAGPGLK